MATAKTSNTETAKAHTNGRKWKKIERTRARFWKPDDDSSALVAKLLERILPLEGARVQRARWLAEIVEPGEDQRGDLTPGERIAIGESVVLADLMRECKPGDVVRIAPAGLDGRVKVYDLEVAEA